MCEPAHSITQFPLDEHYYPEDHHQQALKFIQKRGKRIGNYYHISKFGAGHSLALGPITSWLYFKMPQQTDYEGEWWQREFIVDGSTFNNDPMALIHAKSYHEQLCMGNIKTFRRFFEASLNRSNVPIIYADRFLEFVLNREGQDRFNQVVGRLSRRVQKLSEKRVKKIMGFTRKRDLFVPEWADDAAFWN